MDNILLRIKKGLLPLFTILLLAIGACQNEDANNRALDLGVPPAPEIKGVSLLVLGTVQDAGSPHIACKRDCCKHLFSNPDKNRKVVSLGLIDSDHKKTYLFEATPDISEQLKNLKVTSQFQEKETPDGIFLTHAHIGHYAGLMYLGREAMGADQVPVYAMPRMSQFLQNNGPWDQLVTLKNISLQELNEEKPAMLTPNLQVTPMIVPHRDEYSETVGYLIKGPVKKALFIPDIDKWEKWSKDISQVISSVDYAFLDATFYDGDEINNRDISEIPHPFIIESLKKFKGLSPFEKRKIHFIHFNHTNPLLNENSPQTKAVERAGFQVARINDLFEL